MSEKVYIVKYALSLGIVEATGTTDGNYFMTETIQDEPRRVFLSKNEFFHNRVLAADRAEAMRIARIASLKKQIEKMEKLKF